MKAEVANKIAKECIKKLFYVKYGKSTLHRIEQWYNHEIGFLYDIYWVPFEGCKHQININFGVSDDCVKLLWASVSMIGRNIGGNYVNLNIKIQLSDPALFSKVKEEIIKTFLNRLDAFRRCRSQSAKKWVQAREMICGELQKVQNRKIRLPT